MALTKLYDLAVKTGEYTTRDGQTKGRWKNVGSVMRGQDGGQFMMLDKTFNPAGVEGKPGSDSVLVSMFEPKERDNQQRDPARQAPQGSGQGSGYIDGPDDDLPF